MYSLKPKGMNRMYFKKKAYAKAIQAGGNSKL